MGGWLIRVPYALGTAVGHHGDNASRDSGASVAYLSGIGEDYVANTCTDIVCGDGSCDTVFGGLDTERIPGGTGTDFL